MDCDHCRKLRHQLQQILDKHGNDRHPGLYAGMLADPMTEAVMGFRAEQWSDADRSSMATCTCDCHGPARIAGKLPRLTVA